MCRPNALVVRPTEKSLMAAIGGHDSGLARKRWITTAVRVFKPSAPELRRPLVPRQRLVDMVIGERAITSVSQASGSTSSILAVYAGRRTMPSGCVPKHSLSSACILLGMSAWGQIRPNRRWFCAAACLSFNTGNW